MRRGMPLGEIDGVKFGSLLVLAASTIGARAVVAAAVGDSIWFALIRAFGRFAVRPA